MCVLLHATATTHAAREAMRAIEIRYDKTLSLARSTSALLLQPGLDVLHNHDDIMITYLIFLSPYL